jgi:hypothetical protein
LQRKSFCLPPAKDCSVKPDPQGNALIIKIKYKISFKIEMEIIFEGRKKFEAESLPEDNAQILINFFQYF